MNIIKDKEAINKGGSNFIHCEGSLSPKFNDTDPKEYEFFFNTLFSFENIECNLISLTLDIFIETVWINPDLLEGLNNLKSLKHLYLYNFIFSKAFTLKLYNLEKLLLKRCNNIAFEEKCFS